eukprot:5812545-Pyramimonas_sp.AAC.1
MLDTSASHDLLPIVVPKSSVAHLQLVLDQETHDSFPQQITEYIYFSGPGSGSAPDGIRCACQLCSSSRARVKFRRPTAPAKMTLNSRSRRDAF